MLVQFRIVPLQQCKMVRSTLLSTPWGPSVTVYKMDIMYRTICVRIRFGLEVPCTWPTLAKCQRAAPAFWKEQLSQLLPKDKASLGASSSALGFEQFSYCFSLRTLSKNSVDPSVYATANYSSTFGEHIQMFQQQTSPFILSVI